LPRLYSVFDYTVTIRRKHQYLLVSCPELNLSISSQDLHLTQVSAEKIGETVLRLFEKINSTLLHQSHFGKSIPIPLGIRGANIISCGNFTVRDAARVLGISPSTLKLWVKKRTISYSRTPGGHLRFSIDSIAQLLVENELKS
jgi:excisionase family DNA binding protein